MKRALKMTSSSVRALKRPQRSSEPAFRHFPWLRPGWKGHFERSRETELLL